MDEIKQVIDLTLNNDFLNEYSIYDLEEAIEFCESELSNGHNDYDVLMILINKIMFKAELERRSYDMSNFLIFPVSDS